MTTASRWNPSCRHGAGARQGPTGHGQRAACWETGRMSVPSVARRRDRCSSLSPRTAHSIGTGMTTATTA